MNRQFFTGWLFAFLLISSFSFAGGDKKTKDTKNKEAMAKAHFKAGNYFAAMPLYEELVKLHPKDIELRMKLGQCYLNRYDKHDDAINIFEQIDKEKPKTKYINYYLAKAYQFNYRYTEALERYQKHPEKQVLNHDELDDVGLHIEYCRVGGALYANPKPYKITNLGTSVNTNDNEYSPILPTDESFMLYTYKGYKSIGGTQNEMHQADEFGEYYEDIYISKKTNGKWGEGQSVSANINTMKHDATVSISNDGKTMLLFRDDEITGGDIFVSRMTDGEWTPPVKLKGGINSDAWEGSASIAPDNRTIYFASDREGGIGHRDLYKAILAGDSTYGINNMGGYVNSIYDEDAPFICSDNHTLLFSSKCAASMGEYDIFVTNNYEGSWTKPENMGYPINSPGDDKYYVVSADLKRGYFSSEREGGAGQQDLYMAEPGILIPVKPVVTITGTIFNDLKPEKGSVEITDAISFEKFGTYTTEADGKYIANLNAGTTYSFSFVRTGAEPITVSVGLSHIVHSKDTTIDAYFGQKPPGPADTLKAADTLKTADTTARIVEVINVAEPVKAAEVAVVAKAKNAEGVIFKIQVAAFKIPDNFKFDVIKDLGSIDKTVLDDGITRFTIGSFSNYEEADKLKLKIKSRGIKDAFVTAEKGGKRLSIKEALEAK